MKRLSGWAIAGPIFVLLFCLVIFVPRQTEAQSPNNRRGTVSTTIANGTSLSPAVDCGQFLAPVGIQLPAAWTAAGLTFQGSADGVTYGNIFTGATEYTIASPAASEYMRIPVGDLQGVRFIKIRSGTAGTPVNQGADRILTVVTTLP